MERVILPTKLYWGFNQWHPEPQWLMDAYDVRLDTNRTYALKDCDFLHFNEPVDASTLN